jgi:hypothetical protein
VFLSTPKQFCSPDTTSSHVPLPRRASRDDHAEIPSLSSGYLKSMADAHCSDCVKRRGFGVPRLPAAGGWRRGRCRRARGFRLSSAASYCASRMGFGRVLFHFSCPQVYNCACLYVACSKILALEQLGQTQPCVGHCSGIRSAQIYPMHRVGNLDLRVLQRCETVHVS